MSLLNIGISGLQAQQAALGVVGQNITNASTPGYTRQRVVVESIAGAQSAPISVGGGARIQSIQRIADQFIDEQVRTDTSLHAQFSLMSDRLSQLQGSLFDAEYGIDGAMRDLFSAFQEAATDPGELATRDAVLLNAENLTDRFRGLSERLRREDQGVVDSLRAATVRINEIASALVDLNERIGEFQGNQRSGALNILLDQREVLLQELSTYVAVSTSEQQGEQLNIFIGKGQPLVLGQQRGELSVSRGGELLLQRTGAPSAQIVTASLLGGEIGGLLSYREEVLWPAQNELGQLAAGLGVLLNEQHAVGVDLYGELGQEFFAGINPDTSVGSRVSYLSSSDLGGSAAPGRINVYIDDPLAGVASDYELRFSEETPGAYRITRKTDGELVYQGSNLTVPETIAFDGLRIEFASGDFEPGLGVMVRPYANIAADLQLALSDPASLALAAPVLVDTDAANTGSATLRLNEVVDITHPAFGNDSELLPPLLIEFVTDNQYRILDNSNPAQPVALEPDLGLLSLELGAANSLLPSAVGTQQFSSSGPAESAFRTATGFVSNLSPQSNGYGSGSLTFSYEDGTDDDANVPINSSSSARQIADQLSFLDGVTASARTVLNITGFTDDGAGIDPTIAVNGVELSGFGSLADLADQINASETLSAAGIVARSDGASLRLEALYGDDLNIHFQGDTGDVLQLENLRGQNETLTGGGPGVYSQTTVGGTLSVLTDPGVQVTTDFSGLFAVQPTMNRADFGFDVVLAGNPQAGDRFEINFNENGSGDNRNAQALFAMSEAEILGDPPRNFSALFGSLIQSVGVQASEINTSEAAAQTLLDQSKAFRESISGVNLDEEAADLIRYEQAYNAATQLITVARDIFNSLLNSVS